MKDNYYLKTDRKAIDYKPDLINQMYSHGYLLTRLGKGVMDQTKSLRIDLSKFEPNSENRRIIRKTDGLIIKASKLPLENYSWEIHKMGKEFYSKKFGDQTMSASKIKEMFQNMEKSNMNMVFSYHAENVNNEAALGYCLAYTNDQIVHYAYPFYDLESNIPNLGLGMMLQAIFWAKKNNLQFIYLGSLVTPESRYKLQFKGIQMWDNETKIWISDLEKIKQIAFN